MLAISDFIEQIIYFISLVCCVCIFRYADGELASFSNKIICVREDHGLVQSGEEKEAKNTIVSVDPETQEQHVLASSSVN